jgi:hypothetical protein
MPKPINETLVDARWLEPPEAMMQRGIQAPALLRSSQAIRLHRKPLPLYSPNKGNRRGTRMETDASCVILIRLAHAAPDGMPGTVRIIL